MPVRLCESHGRTDCPPCGLAQRKTGNEPITNQTTTTHKRESAERQTMKAETFTEETHEARELYLYIENTGNFYKARVEPTILTLAKHYHKGDYSPDRARDIWKRIADAGAHAYARDYDHAANWNSIFGVTDRKQVATMLERHYRTEIKLGNY